MNFQIVYEDNHILVLNKPAGLLTQSDATGQTSLEEYVKEWIKQRDQKKGNVFLHAVHRIDKPVSGLVLFAKTSKALSRLNVQMRDKHMEKVYLAYVEGEGLPDEGELEHTLIHGEHRAELTHKDDPRGKRAHLYFSVIKRETQKTLVKIKLTTGRYHQIRCQFLAISHPIMGDVKYGASMPYSKEAIALHHTSFSIIHPTTQERLKFETSPSFI